MRHKKLTIITEEDYLQIERALGAKHSFEPYMLIKLFLAAMESLKMWSHDDIYDGIQAGIADWDAEYHAIEKIER